MSICHIKQTKCLPGQYAIHVDHGWCQVVKMNGAQRICLVEDGIDSYEFETDVYDLKIVDPRRDMMPTQSATVTTMIH